MPILLRDLFADRAGLAPAQPRSAGEREALMERLRRATAADRHAVLVEFIRSRASQLLNLDAHISIPEDQPLLEFGFDSLVGLELKNDLQDVLSTTLPATLFFDFPTIADLSRYLNLIAEGGEPRSVHAATPIEQVSF
jgi:epothilone polyketide synthase D